MVAFAEKTQIFTFDKYFIEKYHASFKWGQLMSIFYSEVKSNLFKRHSKNCLKISHNQPKTWKLKKKFVWSQRWEDSLKSRDKCLARPIIVLTAYEGMLDCLRASVCAQDT